MELWYAIVDLLPFEWAESGHLFFMKNALLAVLILSPLLGLLSTMVVQSRMSFFSDALGHSAFTGVAIGTLCGFVNPIWAAVGFAIGFSLLFTWVKRHTRLASDTVISVFSSTAVALGIFAATVDGGSFARFNALLVGDILSVEPGQIALLGGILGGSVLLWVLYFNVLLISTLHPALADSRGVRSFWPEAALNAVVAVVVTVVMTWVGLLVMNAMLVLPAAAARNLARNVREYHRFAVLGATVCGVAGLMCSYYIGASAGASITLFLAGYFVLAMVLVPSAPPA